MAAGSEYCLHSAHDPIGLPGGSRNDEARWFFSATATAPVYDKCNQFWQEFASVAIEHCNWKANKVAHELSRVAITSKSSCIYLGL